jgi:conjugative transfer region protein TrbK
MRLLNTKGWGVLAAVMVLLGTVVASVITASHRSAVPTAMAASAQPASELDRCRALGSDAGNDAGCQAAWRRLRDHFFGLDRTGARP